MMTITVANPTLRHRYSTTTWAVEVTDNLDGMGELTMVWLVDLYHKRSDLPYRWEGRPSRWQVTPPVGVTMDAATAERWRRRLIDAVVEHEDEDPVDL